MEVLIDQQRLNAGLSALNGNPALTSAAQSYAELLFANGPLNLSHTLDGAPGDRASRAGYSWSLIGEVLAAGPPTSQTMIDLWMGSPAHRSTIMDGRYVDVGVGCASNAQIAVCVALVGSP